MGADGIVVLREDDIDNGRIVYKGSVPHIEIYDYGKTIDLNGRRCLIAQTKESLSTYGVEIHCRVEYLDSFGRDE